MDDLIYENKLLLNQSIFKLNEMQEENIQKGYKPGRLFFQVKTLLKRNPELNENSGALELAFYHVYHKIDKEKLLDIMNSYSLGADCTDLINKIKGDVNVRSSRS